MVKTIYQTLENYKTEIDKSVERNNYSFSNIEKGIQISRRYIQELRIILRNGKFKRKEDEICFFKEQKPFVYGRLKFYTELYIFLMHKPLGSLKSQRTYIDNKIKKLQAYYQRNIDFVKYYREKSTLLDEFYFLRGNDNLALISDTSHFYTDAEFSTSHDHTVAKIIAYDLLLAFYIEELNSLRNEQGITSKPHLKNYKNQRLVWTANKIDAIELIYALKISGAINNGLIDIRALATMFEKLFNIDLGNYYHTFVEIRARKTNQTKYIDYMRDSLLERIQNMDE